MKNTMSRKTESRKAVSKAARLLKKITLYVTTAMCVSLSCAIQAFASASTFMTAAVSTLQTVVSLIGGGVAVWGVVNLLEAYGGENAGSKSQGVKQLVAGIGIIIVANTLIPMLNTIAL